MLKQALTFGLVLLLVSPALTYSFMDAKRVPSTNTVTMTTNSQTVTIRSWKTSDTATEAMFQVEVDKTGDVYLGFHSTAAGWANSDIVKITVANNAIVLIDGTGATGTGSATFDFQASGGGNTNDAANQWTLAATGSDPSYTIRTGTTGYIVEFKRTLTKTDTNDVTLVATATNKLSYAAEWAAGATGSTPTAGNSVSVTLVPATSISGTSATFAIANIKDDYTFTDPVTSGVSAGRFTSTLTGNTPLAIKAALYKTSDTAATLSFTATKGGYVLFGIGGTSKDVPWTGADLVKVYLDPAFTADPVITVGSPAADPAAGKILPSVTMATASGTGNWALASDGATKRISWSYDATNGYKVEMTRNLAASATAAGMKKAINTGDTPTIVGTWISAADIDPTSGLAAPTDSAVAVQAGNSVTVKASTEKDATNNNGSGSNSAIAKISIMLVAVIALFAF